MNYWKNCFVYYYWNLIFYYNLSDIPCVQFILVSLNTLAWEIHIIKYWKKQEIWTPNLRMINSNFILPSLSEMKNFDVPLIHEMYWISLAGGPEDKIEMNSIYTKLGFRKSRYFERRIVQVIGLLQLPIVRIILLIIIRHIDILKFFF